MEHQPTIKAARGPTPRRLWLVRSWHDWCFPGGDHPDNRISAEARSRAEAQLNAFVLGKWMENEIDLKQLDPPDAEAWEIRTYFGAPVLRLFGWFPEPLVYVVTNCAIRDDLEGPMWDRAIQQVATVRRQILPGVPLFHGHSFTHYVGHGGDSD